MSMSSSTGDGTPLLGSQPVPSGGSSTTNGNGQPHRKNSYDAIQLNSAQSSQPQQQQQSSSSHQKPRGSSMSRNSADDRVRDIAIDIPSSSSSSASKSLASDSESASLSANAHQRSMTPFDAPHLIRLQSPALWRWNDAAQPAALTTLTSRSLSCGPAPGQLAGNGTKSSYISLDDIIGVERAVVGYTLLIHAYPPSQGCFSSTATPGAARAHEVTRLTLVEGTNIADAQRHLNEWTRELRSLLSLTWSSQRELSEDVRTRSMLLLVNPASGAGNAASRLLALMPMLKQSAVAYTLQETKHANHAYEIMRDLNFRDASAPTDVVCVSGDGLVHEVVNGLMSRPDWMDATSRVRIGHIGGGSGNGLASTVCAQAGEKIDPISSMFLILKGYTRPLDIMSVKQEGEAVRYGFLSVGYGIVSDIDLESESMRYLGNARFTVAALQRICCLRRYEAELEYLVESDMADTISLEPGAQNVPLKRCRMREEGCDACGHEITRQQIDRKEGRTELEQYLRSVTPKQPAAASSSSSPHQPQRQHDSASSSSTDLTSIAVVKSDGSSLPASPYTEASFRIASDSVSSQPHLSWQCLDAEFTLVWCMNVSHAASDMHVAPSGHFSDGWLDLYFIREVGKFAILSLFLNMESGTHGTSPAISNLKVKGIRLKPTSQKRSELTVDGERLPYKPVEIRVFRGVLNLLAR